MLDTDRERAVALISSTLRAYGKAPTSHELEAWWDECHRLTFDALQAGLKSHREDPDRGERAPRPVDIVRRMKTGQREAQLCAASDTTGRCEYPGIFTDGTMGEGFWFCPLHRIERAGPLASERIEYSRRVPWEQFQAKRIAKRQAQCARTPGVLETAHAIALRHGNKPWQQPFKLPFDGDLSRDEERIESQGNYEGRVAGTEA